MKPKMHLRFGKHFESKKSKLYVFKVIISWYMQYKSKCAMHTYNNKTMVSNPLIIDLQ